MAMRSGLDQTLVRHLIVALVAGVALYLLTEALSAYDNLQLATMAYYFVAVAGLTVLTGQNGQISLGHGALMAVGAYATVKIQDAVSWPRPPGRSPARPPHACAVPTWRARRSRWRWGCPRSPRSSRASWAGRTASP